MEKNASCLKSTCAWETISFPPMLWLSEGSSLTSIVNDCSTYNPSGSVYNSGWHSEAIKRYALIRENFNNNAVF